MSQISDLGVLQAAKRMAALSPQTQASFDKVMSLGWTQREKGTQAFRAIGSAIGSGRQPVSPSDMKELFAFTEQLLKQGNHNVANTVATAMLEQIWAVTRHSGFNFSLVDPYLGPETRSYLNSLG